MADLVIRGMEMPRDCSVCALSQKRVFASSVMCSITGQTVGYYDQGFHLEKHDCHLLPIPEGHGRLIDADALQEEFKKFHNGKRIMIIDTASTIVPEEGSVNDGT